MINITPELHALIPALSEDELNTLEASILSDGIRDPIILWDNTIVDGHNRYEIAKRHGIDCPSVSRDFQSIDDAKIWMIDNQKGRRNLTDGWKYELAQVKRKILLEQGKENMKTPTGGRNRLTLSVIDKVDHNTQKEEDTSGAGEGFTGGKNRPFVNN